MGKGWKLTIGIVIALAVILLVMSWLKGPKTVVVPDVSTGTVVNEMIVK